ncbi:hypothetical protein [Klebsiella pneumoniae]|uniref:hypothetical protein n=1 Tax=Klebsiella pneumoniae TaxID=573 RepID=UPI0022B6F829|nr:hypothetical protein [Klebsiella pneumoniae]
MIVKFHPRGRGGGAGPVDYLLGYRQRDGAIVLQGKPERSELIDASPLRRTLGVHLCRTGFTARPA